MESIRAVVISRISPLKRPALARFALLLSALMFIFAQPGFSRYAKKDAPPSAKRESRPERIGQTEELA